ncbi:MAG: hypothetical protein WCF93_01020 [Candidatus Moraniibacteriota bacterium]
MKKKFFPFLIFSFLLFGQNCLAASKTEVKLKVVRVVWEESRILEFYNPFNMKFLSPGVFVVVLNNQTSFVTYARDRYKEGDEIDPRKISEDLWVK